MAPQTKDRVHFQGTPRVRWCPSHRRRKATTRGRESPALLGVWDVCSARTGERGGNWGEGEVAAVAWPGPTLPAERTPSAQERTPHASLPVCLLACCPAASAHWATAGPGTFTPQHTGLRGRRGPMSSGSPGPLGDQRVLRPSPGAGAPGQALGAPLRRDGFARRGRRQRVSGPVPPAGTWSLAGTAFARARGRCALAPTSRGSK